MNSLNANIDRLKRIPWLLDVLALGFLFVCVLVLFKDAIWNGMVFYEQDTLNFYYPVLSAVQESLKRGVFPLLWTPYILGGYPLFADGEGGMFYPLNLPLLAFLPAADAYVWGMVVRFFLAAAFMYAFARTVNAGRFGAMISALVFAFGSFLVAQMHHMNLANGAIWLPVVLLFAEKALRSLGPKHYAFLALSGVALAVQSLAIHVQPVVMTLLALGFYVTFRVFVGPATQRPHGLKSIALNSLMRLFTTARVLLIIMLVGFSLAAVQLLPLYELSQFSFRSVASDYRFASTYSSTVFNLASLIFPYFFRNADGSSWSIWGAWEPTIYIGIAPLILSGAGVLFARHKYALLFLVLAVIGLSISLGPYSPLPFHWLLWKLPGFSALRAPGRFNFLFLFSTAMLAGFGARWLLHSLPHQKRRFIAYLAAVGAFALWLGWTVVANHQWLLANRGYALALVNEWYVRLFGNPLLLTPRKVYDGLVLSTDLANPATLSAFVLLSAALVLMVLALVRFRRVAAVLLVLLVAGDLLLYAQALHPSMPSQSLSRNDNAVSFLKQRPERIFNRDGGNSLEANRLLPFAIPAFDGYSSLNPDRHREFEWWLRAGNNALLDLAGIRYMVEEKVPPQPNLYRTLRGVYMNPEVSLASGSSASPNSRATFSVAPTPATSVRIIGTLHQALDIPQGQVVAEIVAHAEGGVVESLPIRAGMELSEAAYDRADVLPNVKHAKAQVALTVHDTDQLGRRENVYLYYAELPLSRPMTVTSLDFRYTCATGRVSLQGMSLFNGPSGESIFVRDNSKYREVFEDGQTIIYENQSAMQRAFLTESVRVMRSDSLTLGEMAEGDLDLRKTAVIEEEAPELQGLNGQATASKAEIVEDSSQRVVVEAESDGPAMLVLTDSYYPGWKALVDGQPQKIYRADYLFRGVVLPPGRHRVEFVFDPVSLKLGAIISLASALLILLLGFGYFLLLRRHSASRASP